MAYDIRPLSFGEILDRAFRVYKDRLVLFVTIAACVFFPYQILIGLSSVTYPAIAVIPAIGLLIVAPLMHGAMIVAVANVYLDKPVTAVSAYEAIRAIIRPFMATYLVIFVAILVASGIGLALLLLLRPWGALGALALSIVALYFMISWALILPVMSIEQKYAIAAVKRSHALVRGSWWKTLGILVVSGLIAEIPAAALSFIWAHIPVLRTLLIAATESIAAPYTGIAIVVYYVDRRCRLENFDLHLLAEQIRLDTEAQHSGAPSPVISGQSPVA